MMPFLEFCIERNIHGIYYFGCKCHVAAICSTEEAMTVEYAEECLHQNDTMELLVL